MSQPTLGVLVTYFNEKDLLRECLESLQDQPEGPEEILIYDDASDFPAERYLSEGFRGRVIRGDQNRGPAHGRNVLLRSSQSDYIHYHDSDDLFHPSWCREVRRAIRETGPDVVFTDVSSYVDGQLLCAKVLGIEQLLKERDLVRFCIHNGMLTPSGTYRRQAVLAVGGYRESIWQSEDYDFHIRLASSGVRYAVLSEPLIKMRLHPTSRSSNQEEVWYYAFKAIESLAQMLPPCYRLDFANAAARAGMMLFRIGSLEKAREVFRGAYQIGPPDFEGERRPYRWAARELGPERAERLGALYRRIFPERVRQFVQKMGL